MPREHYCSRDDYRDIVSRCDSINKNSQDGRPQHDGTRRGRRGVREWGCGGGASTSQPSGTSLRARRGHQLTSDPSFGLGALTARRQVRRRRPGRRCRRTDTTADEEDEDVVIPGHSQLAAPFGWRRR